MRALDAVRRIYTCSMDNIARFLATRSGRGTGRGYCLHWKHSVPLKVSFGSIPHGTQYVCVPHPLIRYMLVRRRLKQFQFTAMADQRARVLAFCREQRSQDRRQSHHRRLSVQRRSVKFENAARLKKLLHQLNKYNTFWNAMQ